MNRIWNHVATYIVLLISAFLVWQSYVVEQLELHTANSKNNQLPMWFKTGLVQSMLHSALPARMSGLKASDVVSWPFWKYRHLTCQWNNLFPAFCNASYFMISMRTCVQLPWTVVQFYVVNCCCLNFIEITNYWSGHFHDRRIRVKT